MTLDPDGPPSDAAHLEGAPAHATGQQRRKGITGGAATPRWGEVMPGYLTRSRDGASVPADLWEDLLPAYRARWQRRADRSAARWEDAEPHYRYGWAMATSRRYHDLEWDDVESQVRRDWCERYPDTPWDRVAEDIRDAWDVPPFAG